MAFIEHKQWMSYFPRPLISYSVPNTMISITIGACLRGKKYVKASENLHFCLDIIRKGDLKMVYPKAGEKIKSYDKNSNYLVKVKNMGNLSEQFFCYADDFYIAAHIISEFVLSLKRVGFFDIYIFVICFLYRHCIELGLKAICFQYFTHKDERINFIKETRHNLLEIFCRLKACGFSSSSVEEEEWLRKFISDINQIDKESDSFRYPFHIIWGDKKSGSRGDNIVKPFFEHRTTINIRLLVGKFEFSYEVIRNWYLGKNDYGSFWKNLNPIFFEKGGSYFEQSVVGCNDKDDFWRYIEAYLKAANYIKNSVRHKGKGNSFVND